MGFRVPGLRCQEEGQGAGTRVGVLGPGARTRTRVPVPSAAACQGRQGHPRGPPQSLALAPERGAGPKAPGRPRVSPMPAAPCPWQKLVNENMDTLVQLRSSSCKPEQMAALLPRLTCESGGGVGDVRLARTRAFRHVCTLICVHARCTDPSRALSSSRSGRQRPEADDHHRRDPELPRHGAAGPAGGGRPPGVSTSPPPGLFSPLVLLHQCLPAGLLPPLPLPDGPHRVSDGCGHPRHRHPGGHGGGVGTAWCHPCFGQPSPRGAGSCGTRRRYTALCHSSPEPLWPPRSP